MEAPGTCCQDAVWRDFLSPAVQQAQKVIDRHRRQGGNTADALAPLLGVLMLRNIDFDWVCNDHEFFKNWFILFSHCWAYMLKLSNAELGLAQSREHCAKHYRVLLVQLLHDWEEEVNSAGELYELFRNE